MKLYYYYDQGADVFYLSKGRPSPRVKTRETADDVILRLHPKTGAVVGFTILNFTRRLRRKRVAVSLPIQAELTPA